MDFCCNYVFGGKIKHEPLLNNNNSTISFLKILYVAKDFKKIFVELRFIINHPQADDVLLYAAKSPLADLALLNNIINKLNYINLSNWGVVETIEKSPLADLELLNKIVNKEPIPLSITKIIMELKNVDLEKFNKTIMSPTALELATKIKLVAGYGYYDFDYTYTILAQMQIHKNNVAELIPLLNSIEKQHLEITRLYLGIYEPANPQHLIQKIRNHDILNNITSFLCDNNITKGVLYANQDLLKQIGERNILFSDAFKCKSFAGAINQLDNTIIAVTNNRPTPNKITRCTVM